MKKIRFVFFIKIIIVAAMIGMISCSQGQTAEDDKDTSEIDASANMKIIPSAVFSTKEVDISPNAITKLFSNIYKTRSGANILDTKTIGKLLMPLFTGIKQVDNASEIETTKESDGSFTIKRHFGEYMSWPVLVNVNPRSSGTVIKYFQDSQHPLVMNNTDTLVGEVTVSYYVNNDSTAGKWELNQSMTSSFEHTIFSLTAAGIYGPSDYTGGGRFDITSDNYTGAGLVSWTENLIKNEKIISVSDGKITPTDESKLSDYIKITNIDITIKINSTTNASTVTEVNETEFYEAGVKRKYVKKTTITNNDENGGIISATWTIYSEYFESDGITKSSSDTAYGGYPESSTTTTTIAPTTTSSTTTTTIEPTTTTVEPSTTTSSTTITPSTTTIIPTTTSSTTTTTIEPTTTTVEPSTTTSSTTIAPTTTTSTTTTTTTVGGTTTTVDPSAKIGNTWTTVCSLGTETNISTINYISDGYYYAGTGNNYLYKSSDGVNWQQITRLAVDKYNSGIVSFFDASGGRIIAGTNNDWGRLMKSEDYGLNWTEIAKWYSYDYPTCNIYNIERCGGDVLFTSTDADPNKSKSWKSIDNGQTWNVFIDSGTYQRQNFCYSGNNHINLSVWTKYGNHIIKHSSDNGLTWNDTKTTSASDSVNFISLHSYPNGNGIVICHASDKNIYRSTDFGQTWSSSLFLSSVAPRDNRFSPSLTYLGNGVIIGILKNTGLVRSSDYGQTWTEISPIAGEDFIAKIINLSDGYAVFATRPNGKIYRTNDYGITWNYITKFDRCAYLFSYRELPSPIILGVVFDLDRTNPAVIIKSVE